MFSGTSGALVPVLGWGSAGASGATDGVYSASDQAARLPGKGMDQGRAWNPGKFDPKRERVTLVQLAELYFSNNNNESKQVSCIKWQ